MKQLFTPLFILVFVFCFFSSLFTSAQSTYYVNDNNTGNDVFTTAVGNNANAGTATAPFATLQHAVTQAAANDIIYVDAGSYAEQVIINKGITIIGAGQTLSLFSPPATALVPAPGPFSEIGLFVTTQGIGDVHISHVSINSNGSSQNIIIQSGGSVSNCTLLNGDQGVFFRIESDVKTAVVESNIIQPNGIGINCQGSGLTASIRNNNITKAGGFFAGIYSGLDFGPLPNLTIQNNIIHNYFGDGMLVASFNGNYNLNSIFGSGSYAINRYNNGGTTPNVSCNWFNSADGVFIASKISGTVLYTPWLTDGTDNNAAVGFQPLAGTCVGGQKNIYVNDNNTSGDVFTTAVGNDANAGTSSAPVATITIALTKANPGDIILVDAGNYTEQVTITKNITVRGAGMGVTIINGPNGSIAPPPNFGEKGILQTSQGLSDVIIENLTIDGTNSDEIHSILIQGGGRVSNCEMRNANNGFFFRDHSGTMRTAIGNNNYIHNITYAGILFGGYSMNATATANIIDLSGATFGMAFIAGYGGDGDLASFAATNNSIINFNGWGFYVHSRQSSQIHDNSLTRAAGNFMVNNNAVVMNATCNWYGTADANVIIPNISGAVTYTSWLTNGTDNDAAFGFQPVAGVCNGVQTDFYVNDANTSGDVLTTAAGNNSNTGVSGAPFATLEYALNIAPAGSTIYVDAGTYITPNLSINKSITIRGANYLISPNDASNILLANAARNSESIISGSTFTIDASNITITGLTLDPGNKSAVVLSNTSFGNFMFSKNKSILNSGNFISLTGTSVASPAIPAATGFDFIDNRFEKLGTTGGITFVVNYINSINIDKNSFVVTGPTPRTQVTGAFGQTGLVYNIRFTDNLVDKPNYYMFTLQVSQMVISGNKLYNANFGLFVQITYAGSSDISIENNYIESNMPANTILACRFFGGNNAGSSSAGKVRNNTININATGLTTIGAAISTQMAGITLNPSFEISGNKILHTGNFNLFTTSNLIGLNVAGKLENTTVSNNEISFTGTNLVSPNPSAPNALFTSAIVISTDGGTFNPTAPGSVLTVQNNKLSGYKQSIALFDAVNQAPNTYTGYGNLPSGVIVNIHNNSLTGDSLSINNGTSGQSVNATCNWYGSADEEAVKLKITNTTVQHIPWLTNGTDNDVATGFQPLANICNGYPSALYVNDNSQTSDRFTTAVGNNTNPGTVAAPFGSVSYAISKAKNGDTIYVDAGTYIENIIINKSITLRGAYYGENPLHSLNRGNESIIIPAVQTLGLPGTIIQPAANNITIDGLLLDGDNPALTEGSLINGVDVNIGCGIYNNDIVAANLTVKNTIVKNVQSYGIGLFRTLGNTNGPAVSGNLFTQNRVDNIGTRGIVFGYNAFGDITNNYISRCGLSGTWFSQQRVQNVNNAPSFISGNIVENSNLGMQSSSVQTPASQIIYLNNELSNNTASNFAGFSFIGVGNASGIVAANNKISGFARGVTINASNATIPISINNNSITNFTNFAIEIFSSNPVNATCNWYGSAAAQDFINKISLAADIDIIPWLTNGTDNDAATGFQPVTGACDGYPPVITLNSFTNVTCNGASNGSINITASYGKAPFTFTWTKDGDAAFISNVEDPTDFGPGTYRLSVTDANGTNLYVTSTEAEEPETIVVTITEPSVLTASISNSSTACSNIATVTAGGGTPGYTYLWSNGSQAATISGVPVGTYTVTVTDANGCTTTATVNLTVSEAFNPSASVTNVSCFGGNNGIITVTNANGTAPFMFSKDGGVTFVSGTLPYSFTNLLPGTYTIAVKDANGCVGFIDRTVAQPTQLVASLNTVQRTCFNQSNGAVSVTVTGGVPAYTYRWTGPNGYTSSQLNISGLAAGNYTLTVTDKNGCTYILPVEVQSISEIVVNESISNVTCRGAANGSISATANGGTNSLLGFSYLWNTGSTATTISNLAPGNYNVRITDNGSGCFINKSYIITQPASALALTTTKTNATGCSSLGTITATGSGGTSPYNYSVNGIALSGNSIGSLNAGDYTVSVTDANGCTTSKLVTITDNGSDEYEGNNSKNQAKPMPAGGSLTARLAVANDAADWFRFTAPVSASGLYSVKMTHPNTVYTFNVYASGNNTPPIAPTSVINSGEKHYQLTAGTTYFVSITTATLSFVCYNLTVSALEPIEITANTPPSSITVEAAPTVDLLKAFTYPNPHNGNFTLSIESPEDAVATIEMFTVNGQKLSERKANVVKGKGNTVKYSNMNYAILFYKVRIGSRFVTGKIISPN